MMSQTVRSLFMHAGCVGRQIQYYGSADYHHGSEGKSSSRGTATNHYCGVTAYWQAFPDQVRGLVDSVRRSLTLLVVVGVMVVLVLVLVVVVVLLLF